MSTSCEKEISYNKTLLDEDVELNCDEDNAKRLIEENIMDTQCNCVSHRKQQDGKGNMSNKENTLGGYKFCVVSFSGSKHNYSVLLFILYYNVSLTNN